MRRDLLIPLAAAVVVLALELGATAASMTGAPFAPVTGWGPTRPTDWLAFVPVICGCAALAFLHRFPRAAGAVATASYVAFALRDYELGMFLPPMVAVLAMVLTGKSRVLAGVYALISLGVGLFWVGQRVGPVPDPGTALLAWVAFGTVLAVFFLLPYLLGELVRLRSELRHRPPRTVGARTAGPVAAVVGSTDGS